MNGVRGGQPVKDEPQGDAHMHRLERTCPFQAVNILRAVGRADRTVHVRCDPFEAAKPVKDEQGVMAHAAEMHVPGGAFLSAMGLSAIAA